MIPIRYSIGLLLLFVHVEATRYEDCGSTGKISKVEVSGCPDDSDTCLLQKDSTKCLNIVFQPNSNSTGVRAVVHGIIQQILMPFPMPGKKTDGCRYGITCPMQAGATYNYNNTLRVLKAYPTMKVTVRWQLRDTDKDDGIVCIDIPCQIV